MNSIEVEIKSLLGSPEKAKNLIYSMKNEDSNCTLIAESSQLNHYFTKGDMNDLVLQMRPHIGKNENKKMEHIQNAGTSHSVRTRKNNNQVLFIVKSTIDDTTSENGTARIELEVPTAHLTLDELDNLILKSKFSYQAKWSRERKEYRYKDMTVCVDKNAGYGYLAEFERVITDYKDSEQTKKNIRKELDQLKINELSQDRLQRMFEFYNSNWQDYYGTDKIFTIY